LRRGVCTQIERSLLPASWPKAFLATTKSMSPHCRFSRDARLEPKLIQGIRSREQMGRVIWIALTPGPSAGAVDDRMCCQPHASPPAGPRTGEPWTGFVTGLFLNAYPQPARHNLAGVSIPEALKHTGRRRGRRFVPGTSSLVEDRRATGPEGPGGSAGQSRDRGQTGMPLFPGARVVLLEATRALQ